MAELTLKAEVEKLDQVLDFINDNLESYHCPLRISTQLAVAVEEIFVNIANYAYGDGEGQVTVRMTFLEDPLLVAITFMDEGRPYDPTKRPDPDITLSVDERGIGGLGIYIVKQSMDEVAYRYEDGKNVLTIKKRLF